MENGGDSYRERFNTSPGRDGISCGALRVWELLLSHRIYGNGAGKVWRLNTPEMRRKVGTRRLQILGCVCLVLVSSHQGQA